MISAAEVLQQKYLSAVFGRGVSGSPRSRAISSKIPPRFGVFYEK